MTTQTLNEMASTQRRPKVRLRAVAFSSLFLVMLQFWVDMGSFFQGMESSDPLLSMSTDANASSINVDNVEDLRRLSAHTLVLKKAKSIFEVQEESTRWQSPACQFNLSFYVYENLPPNMSSVVEASLKNSVENKTRLHENVSTEWALLRLFRTSPCRTRDPTQADLFFVPYMHFTHCRLAEGYAVHCGQVSDTDMQLFFASLTHYNKTTKGRHILVNLYDSFMSKTQITKHHFLLTSGPLSPDLDRPGSIIVPIFHDDPLFQPSILVSRNETWWTRPRKYAFVSFYGKNQKQLSQGQPRRFRQYYSDSLEGQPGIFEGLAYRSEFFGREVRGRDRDFYTAYRDSVLCPVLPGDTCWQRRFFDVIRNGCIPVVLEWTLPDGGRSWHPGLCPIEKTYPFSKGMFWNDTNIEIDYDSFVASAPIDPHDESNMTSLITSMQKLLDDPKEITRRQRNMMAYAPLFTFGLGMDSHLYNDGFARIMRILERSEIPTEQSINRAVRANRARKRKFKRLAS